MTLTAFLVFYALIGLGYVVASYRVLERTPPMNEFDTPTIRHSALLVGAIFWPITFIGIGIRLARNARKNGE